MIPVPFHPQEKVLSPPVGKEKTVQGLRVVHVQYSDGSFGLVSCWQMTPEERDEFIRTGKIYVCVMGTATPPLFLTPIPSGLGINEPKEN